MSVSTEEEEPTPDDARKVVYHQKNSAVNPVVTTREVAEELGVSVDEAFHLLEDPRDNVGHIKNKVVAGDDPENHVWW